MSDLEASSEGTIYELSDDIETPKERISRNNSLISNLDGIIYTDG